MSIIKRCSLDFIIYIQCATVIQLRVHVDMCFTKFYPTQTHAHTSCSYYFIILLYNYAQFTPAHLCTEMVTTDVEVNEITKKWLEMFKVL